MRTSGHPTFTVPVPPSPGPAEWAFVEALATPQVYQLAGGSVQADKASVLSLENGLRIAFDLAAIDGGGLLETAVDDLRRLLKETALLSAGGVPVRLKIQSGGAAESYLIRIGSDGIDLEASCVEGARRGIYRLLSEIQSGNGEQLVCGELIGSYWLKDRISRCCFGPIKRPPLNRDELADDVDYYPDAYLSRLAAEGTNGLWLTVSLRELARTSITPLVEDAPRRLAKLRSTVEKCRRYGIKIWLFCIEPQAFAPGDPLLNEHPELAGARQETQICFCPASETARRYLYESTRYIFGQVPYLGGIINISHGERATTCLSTLYQNSNAEVDCPRCGAKPHWQIVSEAMVPMAAGMRDANPGARLICWLYMSQSGQRAEWVYDIAKNLPAEIVLQYNFESNGTATQLDKSRTVEDYWLSYTGPSQDFRTLAGLRCSNGGKMSAKLQVACSHEVATVPCIPVPGILYRKFRQMRALGIDHAMLSWYFGNFPGTMTKAAGMLASETFDDTEQDFLLRLARPDWGPHAATVAAAWQRFAEAYAEFPMEVLFQYYGPCHNGPAWPLHLKPLLEPLSPNWLAHYPPSGDAIGECLGAFTLAEALHLCDRMAGGWQAGLALLADIDADYTGRPERRQEIAIAEALGILFDSARNILRFYLLRAQLIDGTSISPRSNLSSMAALLAAEIENSHNLAKLCDVDPALGFNAEAEAFKFHPAILNWRIKQLKHVLANDFSEAERHLVGNAKLNLTAPYFDSYKIGSGWRSVHNFSWRADEADSTLTIRYQCSLSGLAHAVLYINLLDCSGSSTPLIIRLDPHHPPLQHSWPIIEWERYDADGIAASVHLSTLQWLGQPTQRPDRISLQLRMLTHSQKSSAAHWPDCPRPAIKRLRFGELDPAAMAKLEWD